MKVLITSGGTKIPIDDVRSITNMSKGTFGSRIATMALINRIILTEDNQVTFVRAAGSASPFSIEADLRSRNLRSILRDLVEVDSLYNECHPPEDPHRYIEYRYVTFDDYVEKLTTAITAQEPDVIILAAAVSDYGTQPMKGKVRSRSGEMSIPLHPLPKVINRVKTLSPNAFLVGFKLLVGSTEQELLAAAQKSIADNGCDLVVANDLRDIKNGNHKIMLVTKNSIVKHESSEDDSPYFLALKVIQTISEEWRTHKRSTVERIIAQKYQAMEQTTLEPKDPS